ncbi:hypothetical protein H5410_002945 [Solanum commersonii]|uniref:Uncharacterized protein n=1 Tax=Solanum commersonii TaxID=4109 RepID=A0A9J6B3K8_SOLCO|nr:hypothetical protein H5410_002945 [Solanum commersonii]
MGVCENYNSQRIFIVFKNLCYSESFDVASSSSCSILQYRRVLDLGRHSTASQNCSATQRLLLFTTNLILSFKTQHTRTKGKDKTFWVSRTVLHKTQSLMHTTRLNLLMKRSNVHSKIQVVTHQYQRISYSQYLLQMQVQAQPRCLNALTLGMIPYSHNGSSFKASESDATLTLTKKNTMHNFTHRFARIFQSTFVSAHSRSKRSFQGL